MGVHYLLTGASSGIGAAFLQSISGEDAELTLIVRERNRIEALLKNCRFKEVEIIQADLKDPASVYQKTDDYLATSSKGLPQAFLYAAGIDIPMTAKRADLNGCNDLMNVNFLSFVMIVRALLRRLKKNELLRVLALSSNTCHEPLAGNGIYAASKAAMESFIRSTSLEVPQNMLRINALAPGWVDAPMAWHSPTAMTHEDLDAYLRSTVQPGGLIPIQKVVEKIHSYLDADGKKISGNIEVVL